MLSTSISNVNGFLVQFSTVAVVIVGVYQIANHNLTLGGLIAAVILSSRAKFMKKLNTKIIIPSVIKRDRVIRLDSYISSFNSL
jgi:hypothetical protein